MEGDLLLEGLLHLEVPICDQCSDVVAVVHHLVVAAELRVLVVEGVEAVRAVRHQRVELVLVEHRDVRVRGFLIQVLVACAPRPLAVAAFFLAQHRVVDPGRFEDRDHRTRGALAVGVVRARAPDPVQHVCLLLLGHQRHIEPVRPVHPGAARVAPRVPGALGLRHRVGQQVGHVAFHQHQIAAHVHDGVHVLDEHRALVHAGPAGGAGPQRFLAHELAGDGHRAGGRTAGELFECRGVGVERGADVQHDFLGVQGRPRHEGRAGRLTAPALDAGIGVKELGRHEVGDRPDSERLDCLVFQIQRAQHARLAQRGEERVQRCGDDVPEREIEKHGVDQGGQ